MLNKTYNQINRYEYKKNIDLIYQILFYYIFS